jgi:TonB-linked SusC/RagA family outer membrane protein
MKKFIIILFLFGLLLPLANAQNVTLNFRNTPLKDVLREIQNQTNYRFVYNDDAIGASTRITVNIVQQPLTKALDDILLPNNIVYSINEQQIVLSPKPPTTPSAGAQMPQAQRTITGTVTGSDDNQGIPGVQVAVKGTIQGTTTNVMGQYSLSVPSNATHLVFSFMGMKTQEITIDGKTTIDVVMENDALALEGVVITGYGVTRKAAFTGAASMVGEDVLTRQTGANVITGLQGTMAGVLVSVTSGSPGSSSPIQIRGLGSIGAGRTPLYVIDGVPVLSGAFNSAIHSMADVDPLSQLNAEDIESITILKDATATAIYGSRASNGVVVITTKSGAMGKATINFNMKLGFGRAPKLRRNYTSLPSKEYIDYTRLYLEHTGRAFDDAALLAVGIDVNNYADTDWYDEVTKNALVHEYSLSASGGNEGHRYFVSGGFFQDEGFMIGLSTKRFSVRANTETKLNKIFTWVNSISGSYSYSTGTIAGTGFAAPIALVRRHRPTEIARNPDGSWNFDQTYGRNAASGMGYNPVAMFTDPYGDVMSNDMRRILYTPTLRAKITNNLYAQSKFGYEHMVVDGLMVRSALVNAQGVGQNGYSTHQVRRETALTTTNTLNYLPSFDKHNFNILLGQEAWGRKSGTIGLNGTNFPNYKLVYAINNAADRTSTTNTNFDQETRLMSFFGNMNYDFDNKYYLSVSVRRDGSSRFYGENKWGNFGSVGGRYRISAEEFMKPLEKHIQNLSLRASYGSTGNQDVGWYVSHGLYGFAPSYNYTQSPGMVPTTIPNPNLTWEKKRKFNTGLDVFVFDRVSLEVDYFYDKITDMLFSMPISRTTGDANMMQNIGSMSNAGVEIMANVLLYKDKNIRWTFNVNATHYKNKIIKLSHDTILAGTTLRTAGLPYNQWQVVRYAGVDPQTGSALFYLNDGTTTTNFTTANATLPGTFIAPHRVLAGTSDPTLYGGFGTKIEAYGFDLGLQFVYRLGGYAQNNELAYGESTQFHNYNTAAPHLSLLLNTPWFAYDNVWRKPGDNARLPKLQTGNNQILSTDFGLMPLSYINLHNVTLGYNLPKNVASKISAGGARAYISMDNLWSKYHKDYRGFNNNNNDMSFQDSGYVFPTGSYFVFGINLTF